MKKFQWRVFRNVMLGIVFINKILELPVFHKKNEREKLCITQILSRAEQCWEAGPFLASSGFWLRRLQV